MLLQDTVNILFSFREHRVTLYHILFSDEKAGRQDFLHMMVRVAINKDIKIDK